MLTFSCFIFRDKDPKKSNDKWRIIVDEGLMKIDSFPHFFHGDYCVPRVSGIIYSINTNQGFYNLVISLFCLFIA